MNIRTERRAVVVTDRAGEETRHETQEVTFLIKTAEAEVRIYLCFMNGAWTSLIGANHQGGPVLPVRVTPWETGVMLSILKADGATITTEAR